VPLATAYNTSMHEKFQSDPFNVPFLGLRMKSSAHIKDFFDLIDKGLAIGTAFSGKMEEFIEVRRILRDESASAAPPAARPHRDPRAEARSSSFMVDDEIGAIRPPCSVRALHVPCL